MPTTDPNWQRVTCHPAFAVLLLGAVVSAAWAVTSAGARELLCLMAKACA